MYVEIRKVSSMPVAPYAARTLYLVSGSNGILHVLLTNDDATAIYRSMNTTDISSVVSTTIALLRNSADGLAGLDSSGNLMQVPQTADKWTTAITLAITGLMKGSTSIDGSSSVTIEVDGIHSPIYTYRNGSIIRIDLSDNSYKLYSYTSSGDIDNILHVGDKYVYKKVFNYDVDGNVTSIPRLTYSPQSIPYIPATASYAFTSGSFPSTITYTRAGSVTFTGPNGYEQTANANTPIIDYDYYTLKARGLLIQKPLTNIVKYYNNFTRAVWIKTNMTVASTNFLMSPDNTSYLTLLNTTTAANDNHMVYQNFSASAGDLVMFSLILQNYGYSSAYVLLGPDGVSSGFLNCFVYVDLINGTITNTGSGVVYSDVEKKANNCYLITITGYANLTSSTLNAYIYTANELTSGLMYTGDAARGLLVGGAQVAIGHEIKHTLVPNDTDTVSSSGGDHCLITGSEFINQFGSFGTIILDMSFIGQSAAGTDTMLSLDDGTAANRVQVRRKSNTEMTLFVSQAGITQTYTGIIPSSLNSKIVIAFTSGYIGLWCNSVFIADTYDSTIVPTRLQIGGGVGSTYCSGWVKKLDIFKNMVFNSQMALAYSSYVEPVTPVVDVTTDYSASSLPVTIQGSDYTNNITTKGALLCSFTSSSFTPSVSNCIISIDDTTTKHVIQVSRTTDTEVHIRVRGSLGSIDDYVTITSDMTSKICITWQPGYVAVFINGVLLRKIPGLILRGARIQFAAGIGLSASLGQLNKVMIYKDEIVSDTRAQYLTQWVSEYTEPATPSATKTLTLTSGVAASEISVIRNSGIQSYNSSGYVTTFADNTAAIIRDYPSLVCMGMLVTRATNSTQTYTKDYNSSDWFRSNILSTTINSGLGSDNTLSLTKVVPNTVNTQHYVSRFWVIGHNESATFKLRVKPNELGIIKLEYNLDSTYYIIFNCFIKKLTTIGSGIQSSSFVEEANGVFLITMTTFPISSGKGNLITLYIRDNNYYLSYASNGTDSIYFGELQCSNDSASPIQPMLTSPSNRIYRPNGKALITGSQFTDNLSRTKSAVYCEFDTIAYYSDLQGIISLQSTDERYVAQIVRKSGTVVTAILNTPTITISQDITVASSTITKAFITYMPGYIGFFYNGTLVYEKHEVNMAFDELQLGGGPGIENSYGYIRTVKLYKDTYVTPLAALSLST